MRRGQLLLFVLCRWRLDPRLHGRRGRPGLFGRQETHFSLELGQIIVGGVAALELLKLRRKGIARVFLSELALRLCLAADGPEALEAASQHPGRIDLLVTDVVLPHTTGREVAEALRQQRPEVKVLFISGYTEEAVVRHGTLEPSAAFLQKPFSISDFSRKVRELLDRRE